MELKCQATLEKEKLRVHAGKWVENVALTLLYASVLMTCENHAFDS